MRANNAFIKIYFLSLYTGRFQIFVTNLKDIVIDLDKWNHSC